MELEGTKVLILLGGLWHDFDGFSKTIKPVLEKVGCIVETTYDMDALTYLDDEEYNLVLSYTCFSENREDAKDSDPEGLTDTQLLGLIRWVQCGGSLLAVHSATVLGTTDTTYAELLGGSFISHPEPYTYMVYPLMGEHPIKSGIDAFAVHDEFYIENFDPSVDIHMVSIDRSVAHPMVWSKEERRGRVANIAMGHFPEVWGLPAYQKLMLQTIDWLVNDI